jgi:hypothetical protein
MLECKHKALSVTKAGAARGRRNFVFAFWYFYFAPTKWRLANGLP